MKPWKLGLSIWWPLEGELPDAALMEEIKRAGVDYVETGVKGSYRPEELKDYQSRLDAVITAWQRGGVDVWSVHAPFGRQIDISHEGTSACGVQLTGAFLEVCASHGVGRVIQHPSAEPIAEADRAERLARCVRAVESLPKLGVTVCVENLPRTCLLSRADEVSALLSACDASVCVDVNHYHHAGRDVRDVIRAAAGRIGSTHISDDDGLDEKHWMPGEGVLPWPELMRALAETGYAGAFLYEVKAEAAANPAGIRENYDGLLARL